MNGINNMGGILFAELLFLSEIKLFAIHLDTAIVEAKPGHGFRMLPTVNVSESPTVTTQETDAGTEYKLSVLIRFPFHALRYTEYLGIKNRLTEGCILRCQDAAGNKYIAGTDRFPLFGAIEMVIGKKTTDFSGFELKLSGTSLYPLLRSGSL